MVSDLMTISYVRKSKLSEISAFFRRCPSYVASGNVAVCSRGCRVCETHRRYADLMSFYAKRDSESRPEREFIMQNKFCISILIFGIDFIFSFLAYFEVHLFELRALKSYRTWSCFI